jgi:pimeloyl-ACP methyl ester carboxylesterase
VRRLLAGTPFCLATLFGCAATCPAPSTPSSHAVNNQERSVTRAHAVIRGLRLYYEVAGPEGGIPLVLLHGGGSMIETDWRTLRPLFAEQRRVIALDEQNHGRSDHRPGPERFVDSADDVAALLTHLGVEKADVMGFSNGATTALQVAIRHPARVRKLVFASGLTKRAGLPDALWQFIEQGSMPQQLKDDFLSVTPDPALLQDMHDKDSERMRSFEDIPDAALAAVQQPALVIGGDRDAPTVEHLTAVSRTLPNARLMLFPTGHGEYLGAAAAAAGPYPQATFALVDAFLRAE